MRTCFRLKKLGTLVSESLFVCLFVLNLDFDDSCSLVSPDPEELEIFYHLKPGSFD